MKKNKIMSVEEELQEIKSSLRTLWLVAWLCILCCAVASFSLYKISILLKSFAPANPTVFHAGSLEV